MYLLIVSLALGNPDSGAIPEDPQAMNEHSVRLFAETARASREAHESADGATGFISDEARK